LTWLTGYRDTHSEFRANIVVLFSTQALVHIATKYNLPESGGRRKSKERGMKKQGRERRKKK